MEDLYKFIYKNVLRNALSELMLVKMALEEINKIIGEKDHIIRKFQSGEAILKSKFESIGRVLKNYNDKIYKEHEKTLSEGAEKVIEDKDQRIGKKVIWPVKLKVIQGGKSSHHGESSLQPHLKLVQNNNPPQTTTDPEEAA